MSTTIIGINNYREKENRVLATRPLKEVLEQIEATEGMELDTSDEEKGKYIVKVEASVATELRFKDIDYCLFLPRYLKTVFEGEPTGDCEVLSDGYFKKFQYEHAVEATQPITEPQYFYLCWMREAEDAEVCVYGATRYGGNCGYVCGGLLSEILGCEGTTTEHDEDFCSLMGFEEEEVA